jgi:hypothetical protein
MSLAPLVWMMEEAERPGPGGLGLRFSAIDRQQYHERQNVGDKLYDSRSGLAFYYRYQPRDIAAMCARKSILPKIHTSAVERIIEGPDGYAPGNIPRTARMVGPNNPAVPLKQTFADMQSALRQDSSLLDRVRGFILAREVSQYAVLIVTVIVLSLAVWAGLKGATLESWLDLLSLTGLAKLVGGFIVSAARAARWGVIWLVVAAAGAYLLGWFASRRMKHVFSEFWYDARP